MAAPHARARERRLALLLGLLAAAAILFALPRLRPAREPLRLVETALGEQAERITRDLAPRGLHLPGAEADAAPIRRRPITREELVRVLGVLEEGSQQHDEHVFHRYRPFLREVIEWPEHPAGRWTRATNDEGLREDHPFPDPPPELFVLVTGDSHTEGVCNNEESFSNLLEAALARRFAGRRVEVYNTGVATYSFHHYLGALEKQLPRGPDVFVTVFFGGNDFLEVTKLEHLFAGTAPPPPSPKYSGQMRAAKSLSATALTQGLNQLLYFRENPDQADLALRAAVSVTGEIRRLCREHDVDWIAAYLPSPLDLRLAEWSALREEIREAFDVSEAEFGIGNSLGDRLLAALREQDVETLDLRPSFAVRGEPLYWKDLHIDLRGQELVAELLFPKVRQLLEARVAR